MFSHFVFHQSWLAQQRKGTRRRFLAAMVGPCSAQIIRARIRRVKPAAQSPHRCRRAKPDLTICIVSLAMVGIFGAGLGGINWKSPIPVRFYDCINSNPLIEVVRDRHAAAIILNLIFIEKLLTILSAPLRLAVRKCMRLLHLSSAGKGIAAHRFRST